MSNVRYIVYVNDHSHKEDSIDYEIEFTSIREVVRYTHSLHSTYIGAWLSALRGCTWASFLLWLNDSKKRVETRIVCVEDD